MTYAVGTSASVEKSRAEIERILKRYGASHFAFMSSPDSATIAFRASDRNIRFDLPLPAREKFVRPPLNRRRRSPPQTNAHWDQAGRERWRALVLCIKAKLESGGPSGRGKRSLPMTWRVAHY